MNSEPPVVDQLGWRPSTSAGTCRMGVSIWLGAGVDGRAPNPTASQAKMLPPRLNAKASRFVGAPKDGARPPAAGPLCGASGESPTPGGRGEPGRARAAGVAGVAGSWALALTASKVVATRVAAATTNEAQAPDREQFEISRTLGELTFG